MRPKIVFGCSGGGSGFNNCIQATKDGRLDADIVGMLHNVLNCGAVEHAQVHGIPHRFFPKSARTPGAHEAAILEFAGDGECFFMASGCLWPVEMKDGPDDAGPGLDPRYAANIHPGMLSLLASGGKPMFGGQDMHGDEVHKAAWRANLGYSGLAMHFLTKKYDEGPIVFEYQVPVIYDDWQHLKRGVNVMEHYFQPYVTNLIVHKKIRWDGKDPKNLIVPDGYRFLPQV
ncbi:MAG: phosphoribosylglycinamide formyltransferase, phosphoribosylglycinamide formyltransferase 1 [Candidatus Kaiserbacteria bacterium]|nr:phosphoribosylglycinamide formyltransferase, phosphoribosylglycinamide formyltransferase 1 [Candidatus Kaiserbacteria bacterium]